MKKRGDTESRTIEKTEVTRTIEKKEVTWTIEKTEVTRDRDASRCSQETPKSPQETGTSLFDGFVCIMSE